MAVAGRVRTVAWLVGSSRNKVLRSERSRKVVATAVADKEWELIEVDGEGQRARRTKSMPLLLSLSSSPKKAGRERR